MVECRPILVILNSALQNCKSFLCFGVLLLPKTQELRKGYIPDAIKSRQRGAKLKVKRFATLIILILIAGAFTTLSTPVQAVEDGEWITQYRVEDLNSGQLLLDVNFETGTNTTYAGIFGGANLKITFTINIRQASSVMLKLTTRMQRSSLVDRYWDLVSLNYTLPDSYNPAENTVLFAPQIGKLVMTCYGKITTGTGATKPTPFVLVQLTDLTGNTLDQIRPSVISAEMDAWRVLLEQKEEKLQSLKDTGVAPTYVKLYENVINQSQAVAAQGYADIAIDLLNSLPTSNEPVTSSWEVLFFPAVGILAAIVIVLLLIFMRARGKLSYITLVIEDQIKDLEGLTLRTSKIDRTLSSSLDSIKERLKNIIGM